MSRADGPACPEHGLRTVQSNRHGAVCTDCGRALDRLAEFAREHALDDRYCEHERYAPYCDQPHEVAR